MKKLVLYFNLMLGFVLLSPSAVAQYCTTGLYSTGCSVGDQINTFTLGSYTNANTGCSTGGFGDYTTDTLTLAQGSVSQVTVDHTATFSYSQGDGIWVDFNDDGDWADAGEFIWASSAFAVTNTDNVVMPLTATLGVHRMRVRCSYNALVTSTQSCALITFGEAEDYMVNITLPPPCPAPIFLASSNVTATSAQIDWQSNGTAFNVEYGPTGFTLGSGTSTTSNGDSIVISSLSPNTTYDVYVQNNCTSSGNGTSAWSSKYTFTTACVAVTTYPYTETFDNAPWAPAQSNWPYAGDTLDGCWSKGSANLNNQFQWLVMSGSSGGWQTGPTTDYSGSGNYVVAKGSNFGGGDTVTLNTGAFDLTSLNTPLISFYYHMYNGNTNKLGDVLFQGTTNGVTWVTLGTLSGTEQTASTDPWKEEILDATPVKSANTQFRFVAAKMNGSMDMAFDQLKVEEAPPCLKPTGVNVTGITSSGASFTFISGGHSFPAEWGLSGFTQGTGATDTITMSGDFIGGMPSNTLIDVYLQNDCTDSAKGLSTWAGPFTFRTLCAAQNQGYSNNFDALTVPNLDPCWSHVTFTSGFTPGTGQTYAPFSWNQLQANSSPNVTRLYIGDAAYSALMTPELFGLDGDSTQIRFQLGHDAGSTATMNLLVGTVPFGNDTAGFVIIDTLTPGNAIWTEYTLLLDNVPAGHSHVAFVHTNSNNLFSNFYFDDFFVEPIPNCLPPTGITASGVTSNSAILSWTAGGVGPLNIEYGPTGFGQGTGTTVNGATGLTDTLTNLFPNTCYDVYFQTDCGVANGTSPWVGPITFCTLCNAKVAPWTDDLDGGGWLADDIDFSSANSVVDPCWNRNPDNGTSYSWRVRTVQTGSFGTGPSADNTSGTGNYAYIEGSNAQLGAFADLETPLIDVSALTQPELAFFYHMFGGQIDRLLIQANYDNTGWVTIDSIVGQTQTATTDPYLKRLNLLDTGKTLVQIRFRGVGLFCCGGDIAIDDVSILEAPVCPDPTQISSSNAQGFSVDINWVNVGSATSGYRVEYGPTGFIQGTGGGTIDSTTTNLYSVTGLTPVTCYDIYVQSNCGPGSSSAWVGPFNFCTTVSCPAPTGVRDSAKTTTSAIIKWNSGGASDWNISWGPAGTAAGAGTLANVTGTTEYAISGLTDCTPYAFWVRDSCGAGDVSTWEGPYDFTTEALTQSLPFSENFDFGLGCWGVVDGGATNDTWQGITAYGFASSTLDGTPFAHVDSDAAGSGAGLLQEELITPPIDASGTLNLPLTLDFDQFYNNLNDSAMVDVWDGTQWVNVLKQTANSGAWGAPNHQTIDISTYANANLKVRFRYDDAGVWAWYWAVDNVVIADVPSCTVPTALMATSVTQTSATINWTTGGATDWNVQYGPAGFTPGTGTFMNVSTNPTLALTGLTGCTAYDVYVRDSCGLGDVSAWVLTSFSTLASLQSLPFMEDFNTGLGCWTILDSGTTNDTWEQVANYNGNTLDGTGFAFADSDGAGSASKLLEYLITPQIDASGLGTNDTLWLEFDQYYNHLGSSASVEVWDGTQWSNVVLQNAASAGSFAAPDKQKVDITMYANAAMEVRFVYDDLTSWAWYWAIDNVNIYSASGPTGCIAPSSVATSNITCTEADLSWISDAGTMLTFVRFDTTGFNPATSGTLLINPTSPAGLTGLMPGTTYDVWVADSCSLGTAATMYTFTTAIAPLPTIAVTHNQVTTTATSATVEFDASGTIDGDTYTWDFGGGNMATGDSAVFFYASNGSFPVTLTVTNGCGSVDTTFNVIVQGISVEESALGRSLQVFPNPNDGNFNVSFVLDANEKVELRVLNAAGQIVLKESLGSVDRYDASIDLSAKAKGMYILQIETSQGIINRKVTIQ